MTKVASLFGLESLTVLWTGSCCALHRPRGEIKSLLPLPSRGLHVLSSRRPSCLFRRLGRFQVRDSRFRPGASRPSRVVRGTSRAAAPPARLPSGERPRPRAGAGSGRLPALGTWPMASTFRYWPRASDYSPFRAAAQVTLGLPASR